MLLRTVLLILTVAVFQRLTLERDTNSNARIMGVFIINMALFFLLFTNGSGIRSYFPFFLVASLLTKRIIVIMNAQSDARENE